MYGHVFVLIDLLCGSREQGDAVVPPGRPAGQTTKEEIISRNHLIATYYIHNIIYIIHIANEYPV